MEISLTNTVNIKLSYDNQAYYTLHFTGAELKEIHATILECLSYTSESSVLVLFPIWAKVCKDSGIEMTYEFNGKKFSYDYILSRILLKLNFYNYRKLNDYHKIFGVTYNDGLRNT